MTLIETTLVVAGWLVFAICPPFYLYGCWKLAKYRKRGERTGRW